MLRNWAAVHPRPAQATPHSASHLSHERFLREARSAATLNHSNVCAIYDTGEQDGRPYLVMELLRGETLKRYLARAGEHGLAPDEVVSFAQQAAAALAAAHRKGIIHRDIKPANLFVLEADRGKRQIKILDFGLAKKQAGVAAADSRTFGAAGSDGQTDLTAAGPATMGLTSPGSAVGTVAYMSPEQAKGEPVDVRTDLFSLGTVIYEMATGKTPFAGNSTAEVFVSLLRENPPPVSTVNPAMPRKLDAMVQKLLAKDPASRYATAEALREDLEGLNNPAALGAKNGSAKPATGYGSRAQWCCCWLQAVLHGGSTGLPLRRREKPAVSKAELRLRPRRPRTRSFWRTSSTTPAIRFSTPR